MTRRLIPTGFAAAACLAIFGLAMVRFATLQSNGYDLGFFDQVVWNAAHGRGFESSFNPYPFFGQHFSPALAVFVPFYWLHPSPVWLLAGQSLALGLAVLPLYSLAAHLLRPPAAVWVCALYLLQLFVIRAIEFDFHTEALAVPFVFLAVFGAARERDRTLIVAGLVPLLCKEDGALVTFGIGLVALAVFRRRAGAGLMLAGVAWALVVVVVVMPALRHGVPSDLLPRYGYLIGDPLSAARGALAHLLDPSALQALGLVLLSLGFLPLLRPVALVAALPPLVLALLSNAAGQHLLQFQYGLQSGPLLFVAALLGWQRLRPGRETGLVLVVLASAVLWNFAPRLQFGDWSVAAQAGPVLSAVPRGAPVAAASELLPRLAERPDVAQFPQAVREYIAVDGRKPMPPVPEGYQLVVKSGPFSLWRRGVA